MMMISKREPDPTPEELLENASVILKEVDKAPIFKALTAEFPSFSRKEIKLGKVLGIGGFGVVREISSFRLIAAATAAAAAADDAAEIKKRNSIQSAGEKATTLESATDNNDDAVVVVKTIPMVTSPSSRGLLGCEMDSSHYDVCFAREIMSKRCLRHGEARYAMKHLQGLDDLTPLDRARGRIDLAIEVKYLRALHHPNIIRMRGVLKTENLLHLNYFFVMDRLYGTLEDKIEEWKKEKYTNRPKVFQRRMARQDSKEFATDLLTERLTVAYDLASAFRYMHAQKLIYRDTKQENIGFDVRGDVKVFDFGLAKSMQEDLYAEDGLYHLTARTGSFPYMAPEIVLGEPYNEKCDVFSYAILVWEILALKPSFPKLKTRRDFQSKIAVGGARPAIPGWKWGVRIPKLLKAAWKASPKDRPSMNAISLMLRTELADSSRDDEQIENAFANRSELLKAKSMKSMCLSMFKQSASLPAASDKRFSRAETF